MVFIFYLFVSTFYDGDLLDEHMKLMAARVFYTVQAIAATWWSRIFQGERPDFSNIAILYENLLQQLRSLLANVSTTIKTTANALLTKIAEIQRPDISDMALVRQILIEELCTMMSNLSTKIKNTVNTLLAGIAQTEQPDSFNSVRSFQSITNRINSISAATRNIIIAFLCFSYVDIVYQNVAEKMLTLKTNVVSVIRNTLNGLQTAVRQLQRPDLLDMGVDICSGSSKRANSRLEKQADWKRKPGPSDKVDHSTSEANFVAESDKEFQSDSKNGLTEVEHGNNFKSDLTKSGISNLDLKSKNSSKSDLQMGSSPNMEKDMKTSSQLDTKTPKSSDNIMKTESSNNKSISEVEMDTKLDNKGISEKDMKSLSQLDMNTPKNSDSDVEERIESLDNTSMEVNVGSNTSAEIEAEVRRLLRLDVTSLNSLNLDSTSVNSSEREREIGSNVANLDELNLKSDTSSDNGLKREENRQNKLDLPFSFTTKEEGGENSGLEVENTRTSRLNRELNQDSAHSSKPELERESSLKRKLTRCMGTDSEVESETSPEQDVAVKKTGGKNVKHFLTKMMKKVKRKHKSKVNTRDYDFGSSDLELQSRSLESLAESETSIKSDVGSILSIQSEAGSEITIQATIDNGDELKLTAVGSRLGAESEISLEIDVETERGFKSDIHQKTERRKRLRKFGSGIGLASDTKSESSSITDEDFAKDNTSENVMGKILNLLDADNLKLALKQGTAPDFEDNRPTGSVNDSENVSGIVSGTEAKL